MIGWNFLTVYMNDIRNFGYLCQIWLIDTCCVLMFTKLKP